jgi:hypothetical protein
MKQFINSLGLILLLPCLSFSQEPVLGVSTGGALSAFTYDDASTGTSEEGTRKLGFTGGIKLEYKLFHQKWIRFVPEIFAIQNGSKEFYADFSALANDVSRQVKLDYIGIYLPLHITLFGEEGRKGMFLFGGGYADYTFNAQLVNTFFGQTEESDLSFKKATDKIDFGYHFGLGFTLDSGVHVQIGYCAGLKNIEFSTSLIQGRQDSYYVANNGVTLSFGFMFGN